MRKFTVSLPIDVSGRIYQHGETIELDDKTANLYSHALIAQAEEGEKVADHNTNK